MPVEDIEFPAVRSALGRNEGSSAKEAGTKSPPQTPSSSAIGASHANDGVTA